MRNPGTPADPGADVLAELRRLEAELARALASAASRARGSRLPGAYLLVETAGQRALVPAAQVEEIVRLVATTPLPGAPPLVAGSFVHRGRSVVAIDLAHALGRPRVPALDAHLVVVGASRPFALLVDRTVTLVDGPTVEGTAGDAAGPWGTGLVAALCRAEGEVVPLLRLASFVALAEETTG